MRIIRNFIVGLLLVLVGIAAIMLIPSPQPPASKPWEVTVMPDNNVKVFGIHLGKTDYKTAQQALRVFGKTAIFTDPDNKATVEAYFDSVNLGGLSAKMVLNLDVDEDKIADILERASAGKLQPSGAHQHELAEEDKQFLLSSPVAAITYIPSVRLDEEMIEERFGAPDSINTGLPDDEGNADIIWLYQKLNLTVIFSSNNKTLLIYQTK
ncbi:lytic murein transglycosylase [Methylophaga sp.]|uniref:lytic murein transglycosylase n=1 Tax=Methylophaga sp. TaxID=2024840 RepID=UPI003A8D2848